MVIFHSYVSLPEGNTTFIDISICGPQGHGLTHNQLHQRRGVGAPTFDDATELELLLCPRVRMS